MFKFLSIQKIISSILYDLLKIKYFGLISNSIKNDLKLLKIYLASYNKIFKIISAPPAFSRYSALVFTSINLRLYSLKLIFKYD